MGYTVRYTEKGTKEYDLVTRVDVDGHEGLYVYTWTDKQGNVRHGVSPVQYMTITEKA